MEHLVSYYFVESWLIGKLDTNLVKDVQSMAGSERSIGEGIGDVPPARNTVHRLNLNLLYPLNAILHSRTLTEAGLRISLGQSTMSHALRRLRAHFHDDLVVLAGGEWQLTALGLALRGEVRRLMREVEGAFNFSITFDPLTTTETITIAATETTEQLLLGPVLRGLAETAPSLIVNIIALDIDNPQRSLDRGADLLLLPEHMVIDELEAKRIIRDRASCMVWNRHPDLQDCHDLTEAQYRAARHIVAHNEPTETFARDQAGLAMLRDRRICVRTTSLAALPAIVVGSNLVATGSSWLFQNYAQSMPLKVFAAPFARQESAIVAQWPRHRRNPMLTWFLAQIQARDFRAFSA